MQKKAVDKESLTSETIPARDPDGLGALMERAVARAQATPAAPSGLLTGRIVAFGENGVPMVECGPLQPGVAVPAASLVVLDAQCLGRRVAVMCADGNRDRPVIMGLLAIDPAEHGEAVKPSETAVRVDGKSVTLSASEEIVLQCGKASIVLTRSGKILVRGTYVSNLSTGVIRLKGGSVQIN